MDRFDLGGRVAVVTGGNRGIGLGYARGLVKAGAAVAIWARNEEANREAALELSSLGGEVLALHCDVTSEGEVDSATTATLARFGHIDALFANAGLTGRASFPDMGLDEWQTVTRANEDGTFLPVRSATRCMIEQGDGGAIVVTSSVGASRGLPVAPHYSASKAAQLGMVKALAVRLARHRIRVNAVSPGWVATEMTAEQQGNESFAEALRLRVPMRRWGTPEDFEGIAVFLASDASGFMTGAEVVLDGGYSAF